MIRPVVTGALLAVAMAAAAPAQGPAPVARACHAMTWDGRSERVVLYGGARECGVGVHADDALWSWDGTTWQVVARGPGPGTREDALLAWDAARRVLVLYGGRNAGTVHEDTWEWDGDAWARKTERGGPGRVEHAAMAFDGGSKRVVLFGGAVRGEFRAATWEWDGVRWTQRVGAGPPARVGHSMAGTPSGVVLYGGFDPQRPHTDYWLWHGGKWTLVDASGPAETEGPALVAARDGQVFLLGPDAAGKLAVWKRVEKLWVPLAATGAPPSRVGQAVAYDARREAVVLFGGAGAGAAVMELRDGAWQRRPR